MGKKADRAQVRYDKMAAWYDTSPEGRYTKPHKAEIVRQAAVRDGDNILDVACGNGFLLGELSKKAKVHAFGIDLSENMIAAAEARYPDYSFAVRHCVPLPFEEKQMDVITVSCAFHHFEDPQAFADECNRVLKKNGAVYLAEPFFSPVVRWLANAVVFRLSKTGDVRAYHSKELSEFFETAGFCDVVTYRKGPVLFLSARK